MQNRLRHLPQAILYKTLIVSTLRVNAVLCLALTTIFVI